MIKIEDVIDRLDIVDVLEFYTGREVKRSGSRYVSQCADPNHPDRNPSMVIYPETKSCHCFSCNKNFDILDIAGFYTGADTLPAKLEALCRDFSLEVENGKPFNLLPDDFPLTMDEIYTIDEKLLSRTVENTMFKNTKNVFYDIPKQKTFINDKGEEEYNPVYISTFDESGNDITNYYFRDGHIGQISSTEDYGETVGIADMFLPNEKSYAAGGILNRNIIVDNILDLWAEPESRSFCCDILLNKASLKLQKEKDELQTMFDKIHKLVDEEVYPSDSFFEKVQVFEQQNKTRQKEIEKMMKKVEDKKWQIENPGKRRRVIRNKKEQVKD